MTAPDEPADAMRELMALGTDVAAELVRVHGPHDALTVAASVCLAAAIDHTSNPVAELRGLAAVFSFMAEHQADQAEQASRKRPI